jgi:molybdate transport system substrate-binding protein
MNRRLNWLCTPLALAVSAILFFSNGCSRQPPNKQVNATEITVAAAADLTPAFEEIGKRFEQETGVKVTFLFGSTGTLAQQIENGAPVDLFAAANISFVESLERKGLIVPDTKALYGRGRIVVWTRSDSPLKLDRLEDLVRPEIKHIAIANPGHAPYGMAAREAMERVGVLKEVQPRLVLGENVRQAMQFAETGNADVAVIALSLAMQSQGHWTLVPDHLHQPLDQALAVIKATKHEDAARRFAAFINSEAGREIMRKYGFILPSEVPA